MRRFPGPVPPFPFRRAGLRAVVLLLGALLLALPARAQITTIVSGDELIVLGTNAGDSITLTCDGGGNIKVNGNDPDTGPALCNVLNDITIDSSDGDDIIDVSLLEGPLGGGFTDLTINSGEGNDDITGSPFPEILNPGPGNDTGNLGDGGDQITYNRGTGFDQFNLGLGDDLVIFMGIPGDENIDFSNSFGLPLNTFLLGGDSSNRIDATDAERYQIEPLGGDSDIFFFLDPCNIEFLVKVLDNTQTPFADHFWVFAAALNTVEYTLTVTDTDASTVNTFFNPLGTPAPPIMDTMAFATCPERAAKAGTSPVQPGVQFFIANAQHLTFNTGNEDDILTTIGVAGVTQIFNAEGMGFPKRALAGDELVVDAQNQNAMDTPSAPGDGTVQVDGAGPISYTGVENVMLQNVLPVELISFEAMVDAGDVVLAWATASETNNAGFEVQGKSANTEATFESIGFVEGQGTTTLPQQYRHRIEALAPGHHVFRLKQIDFDGAFEYSPEVEVAVEVAGAFQLTAAYPNPFNPQTTFTLAVRQAQHATAAVYNLLGQRVAVLFDGMLPANETQRFAWEAAGQPSGVYIIRIEGEHFVTAQSVSLLR